MKWTGATPLYFLQKTGQYNITTSAAVYQNLLDDGWQDVDGSPFVQQSNVGFIYTDFTYPGQLIGNAGEKAAYNYLIEENYYKIFDFINNDNIN